MYEYDAKNLVKQKTCFKSIENPSCIDVFLTNSYRSFNNTTTISTGLSDFHKMSITVLRSTFQKAKPKDIFYRDYKNFDEENFRENLKRKLNNVEIFEYDNFENIFLEDLSKHAPLKKKILRANHAPYMTKILRKAIMRRSALENKYYKDRSVESKRPIRNKIIFVVDYIKKKERNILQT